MTRPHPGHEPPTYRWQTMATIAHGRVLGIVRAPDDATAAARVRHLFDIGIPAVEVSMTTPGALDVVAALAPVVPPDAVLGVGTVLDSPTARLAVLAGARFLVCPTLHHGVIRVGLRYGVAVIPGCATPTEMLSALTAGADAVKLFPASTWRPADLAALLEALPQIPVVPTGGAGLDDVERWLDAGAVAVGLGGALARDHEGTEKLLRRLG